MIKKHSGKTYFTTSCLLYFCLLYSSVSLSFTCPTNFNEINIGDTQIQVNRQCGKPNSQTVEQSEENIPQEWSYFVKMNTSFGGTSQNSINMSIAFNQGKVINITVMGTSAIGTGICGAGIRVGYSQQAIKKACGEPFSIQKSEMPGTPKSIEKTIAVYNTSPPVTLIFENGILVERQ